MARLTKKELSNKKQALEDAIYELFEKSTPSKCLLIYEDICDVANSSDLAEDFTTKISISSIKQPVSQEFKDVRELYLDKKKELKKQKNHIGSGLKKKIKNLEIQNSNLIIRIAELLDNEIKLQEIINQKDLSLNKIKEQRDAIIKRNQK